MRLPCLRTRALLSISPYLLLRSVAVVFPHSQLDSYESQDTVARCMDHVDLCWLAMEHTWKEDPYCKGEQAMSARKDCDSFCKQGLHHTCSAGKVMCGRMTAMCAYHDMPNLMVDSKRKRLPLVHLDKVTSLIGIVGNDMTVLKNASLKNASLKNASLAAAKKFTRKDPEWFLKWYERPEGVFSYDFSAQKAMEGRHMQFLHIPLNWGETVERLGAAQGMKWGMHLDVSRLQMSDGHWCHKTFVPPYLLPVPNQYTRREVFTIVRHPYDRMLAEYKHLLVADWGGAWGEAIYEKQPCSAESLNHWLQHVVGRFMRGERYINDCHMLPQSEYITGGAKKYVNWEMGDVLKAHELPEAFDDLMKTRHHKIRLPGLAVLNQTEMEVCPRLSRLNLTTETKALLHTAYNEDFKTLHFKMDKMRDPAYAMDDFAEPNKSATNKPAINKSATSSASAQPKKKDTTSASSKDASKVADTKKSGR